MHHSALSAIHTFFLLFIIVTEDVCHLFLISFVMRFPISIFVFSLFSMPCAFDACGKRQQHGHRGIKLNVEIGIGEKTTKVLRQKKNWNIRVVLFCLLVKMCLSWRYIVKKVNSMDAATMCINTKAIIFIRCAKKTLLVPGKWMWENGRALTTTKSRRIERNASYDKLTNWKCRRKIPKEGWETREKKIDVNGNVFRWERKNSSMWVQKEKCSI